MVHEKSFTENTRNKSVLNQVTTNTAAKIQRQKRLRIILFMIVFMLIYIYIFI